MIEYTNKIAALYSRLSVDDEDRDDGEINSIVNQKVFSEIYARQHPDIGNFLTPLRIPLAGGMRWLSVYDAMEGK